jgi:hypothetical protein
MFDHVKRVAGWTTMACHVYDHAYCKVMTIVICDMQSKDIKVQQIMWIKLNETMLKHMFPKLNFKGFMIDNTQANWNTINIVYGYGDPFVKIADNNSPIYSIGLSHSIGTQKN